MDKFKEIIEQAIVKATTEVPPDVYDALSQAVKQETEEIAKKQLQTIIESIDISSKRSLPVCQDTGLLCAFVNGEYVGNHREIREALETAIMRLTSQGMLRHNLVSPITRIPVQNNVGFGEPEIYLGWELEDSIKFLLKGAGAENYTVLKMFLPSTGLHEINKFILEKTLDAGGRICPPSILGIAVGGSPLGAILESRKALFSKIGERSADKKISDWERRLLSALNSLDIGPMGLGGRTSVLDVKIRVIDTHIAMMPVAITYNCWALRRIQIRKIDGLDRVCWWST
ncbi:MAG: fumarate hydratase [Nitrososphaeria archaeon]